MGVNNGNGHFGIVRSMSTAAPKVQVDSYFGPDAPDMLNLEPTQSRIIIPQVPITYRFQNKPSHKYCCSKARGKDWIYNIMVKNINGEDIALLRNPSRDPIAFNAKALIVDGNFSPVIHEEDLQFYFWDMNCKMDKAIEYVEKAPEGIILVGKEQKGYSGPWDTALNKYVSETFYEGDFNKVGINLSKQANLKEDIKKALSDDDRRHPFREITEEFITEYLTQISGSPHSIDAIGVRKMEPGFAAQLKYTDDGAYLIASADFGKEMKKYAEDFGQDTLEGIDMHKLSIIYHEFAHAFQHKGSRNSREFQAGEIMYNFFLKKAAENKGTKLGDYYLALAAESHAYAEEYRGKIVDVQGQKEKSHKLTSKVKELSKRGKRFKYKDKDMENYVNSEVDAEDNEIGVGKLEELIEMENDSQEAANDYVYNPKKLLEKDEADLEETIEEDTEAEEAA